MRISDWRSDVCSSDLHRPARLGPHARRDRRQLEPGVLEELLQALDLLATSPDLGLAVAGQLPQTPNIRWRHKARTDHPMSSHIRQPLRVGHVGLRSEEHTSELQSLMRISYAGFCLNKKK